MRDETITLRIITAPLPQGVHGLSAKDGATITVVINEADALDQQERAFLHEMRHVWNNDHDREGANVTELETIRHRDRRETPCTTHNRE